MLAVERQKLILRIITDRGQVTTAELSKQLSVSPATIRNDLNKLNREKLINKTHGGATALSLSEIKPSSVVTPQNSYSFKTRESKNAAEKEAISKEALSMIRNDQCILLDGSSTALTLARKLSRFEKLLVITNGIYTMLTLKDMPNINVVMIGGIVTKNSGSVEGLLGAEILDHIHIDIGFVSSRGFSLEEGCTDFNIYEVELKRAMLSKCSKKVILLDSSKFEHVSTSSFMAVKDIDMLITDENISDQNLKKYVSYGLNVKLCMIEK